jgi:hypothetical protein
MWYPSGLQKIGTVVVAAFCLIALAACGSSTAPGGTPSSPAPHASRATTSPPTAAASPSPAQASPKVVLSRVTYSWNWPNNVNWPGNVRHDYAVPPVPTLIAIAVGNHPSDPGDRPYNRMSFTFTGGFPSYQFKWVSGLVSDPGGQPISLTGDDVLEVIFSQAQAHTASGQSSVVSQPPSLLGLSQMVSWARAGDFEGVLTYGIGTSRFIAQSNPQTAVRTVEVEQVTAQGQHLYIVAIDIDSAPLGSN